MAAEAGVLLDLAATAALAATAVSGAPRYCGLTAALDLCLIVVIQAVGQLLWRGNQDLDVTGCGLGTWRCKGW